MISATAAMRMKKLEDICEVRVRFSEADMMGVAWHGSYVKYLEDGRESFGAHFPGLGYADIAASGIFAPMYDMHIKYLSPLHAGDTAVVHTRYVPRRGARLDFEYDIVRKSDGMLCAKATTVQLFISPDGELMAYEPDYYAEWKRKFMGNDKAME